MEKQNNKNILYRDNLIVILPNYTWKYNFNNSNNLNDSNDINDLMIYQVCIY